MKRDPPSALTQEKSARYEPPAINFHLWETPTREPYGRWSRPSPQRETTASLKPPTVHGWDAGAFDQGGKLRPRDLGIALLGGLHHHYVRV